MPAEIAPSGRIIDKDVDFYTAEVEECRRRLRTCTPPEEPYWIGRTNLAVEVLDRLQTYRLCINQGEANAGRKTT